MTKKIIGRVDKVDFPKLNLLNIAVKIDSGANTSAIHCSKIIEKDSILICCFDHSKHYNLESEDIRFENYTYTDVKSSNGFKENRYKIKSEVIFFGKRYKINLTLTTRDDMKFSVLIGRQFLSKKFIIDVDLEDQSFNSSKS